MKRENIRNFAIIAHVDHGKSTLADRLLEITGTVAKEKIGEQYLDQNQVGREHGITIKLAPVRMVYKVENGKLKVENYNSQFSTLNSQLSDSEYILNLIDTPGHVDFSYEVIRTLYACDGAILLVDAAKGIQAQTVANYNFAKKLNLKIIPAINKIDLPTANIEKVESDLCESFGFAKEEILKISAKTGQGVNELITEVIEKIPSPQGENESPLQAFIFDSVYDEYRGVVIYVRVKNGLLKKNDEIVFLSDNSIARVFDLGYMQPSYKSSESLIAGDVGYIITNIKDISLAKVGDTITNIKKEASSLPGYVPVKPFVFLSIYPESTSNFGDLRKALLTLKLNDASLTLSPEHSIIFGPGFRCGFLGLLHAQIVIERIEKEFGLGVFAAPPSIEYIVDGEKISNPKDFDLSGREVKEPFIKGEIYTPSEHLGSLIDLIHKRRGESREMTYFGSQVRIVFDMPLSGVIFDFYDKIKSLSAGFASFDYEFLEYRESDLLKVDISLNDKIVPELSFILHKSEVESFSRSIVQKLQENIPKHQFVVSIRAQVGSRIIASEKVAALHKNVIAKLSGGDYTRKSKLLSKQKKGKEKLKKVGDVSIPKEAFLSILKV